MSLIELKTLEAQIYSQVLICHLVIQICIIGINIIYLVLVLDFQCYDLW